MDSRYSRDSLTSPTPTWQTVVSLLIFAHLFFVLVALSANHVRSGIAARLLSRFAFYTRFFNFDLNFTPYHLTHGTDSDVDHRVEVLPRESDDWLHLPDEGFRGHDAYQRLQRYAAHWALEAANDSQPALFAQAVGTYFSRGLGIAPRQVRCRKLYQQSREDFASTAQTLGDSPDALPSAIPYAANAIVNADGTVEVVRIEDASQVAAPVQPGNRPRGTRNP